MSTLRVTAEVLTVHEHPNADALELAQVGLYRAVVAKGAYRTGDAAVYIPEQSVLPAELIEELGLTGRLAGSSVRPGQGGAAARRAVAGHRLPAAGARGRRPGAGGRGRHGLRGAARHHQMGAADPAHDERRGRVGAGSAALGRHREHPALPGHLRRRASRSS